jgi:hypothetical protein
VGLWLAGVRIPSPAPLFEALFQVILAKGAYEIIRLLLGTKINFQTSFAGKIYHLKKELLNN